MWHRSGAIAVAMVLWAGAAGLARADGDAGLIVDYGNGVVQTYCIPFTGDSISGADLLQRAGISVGQFSGMVCSLNGAGCQHSGSFDSCHCECKAGGDSCNYWTYFYQRYGQGWVYSSQGYSGQNARDGDLQQWKWQQGGGNSAPPPAGMTFESICGRPPMSQLPPTAVPTSTPGLLPPTSTPTLPPSITVTITAAAATATRSATTPIATIPASPSSQPAVTTGPSPAGTAGQPTRDTSPGAMPTSSPSPTSQAGATATVAAPAAGNSGQPAAGPGAPAIAAPSSDGGGRGAVITFAAIAGALVLAIGAAAWWRRRHG